MTGPATRRGDSIFAGLATGAGVLIMVALAGVGIFLLLEGAPAITASGEEAYGADNIVVYVWPLLFGTLLAAVIALIMAVPLAIGVALVISHYAPRRVAKPIGYLIDLLAAIPSVVYGLWGRAVLAPAILPVYDWLADPPRLAPVLRGPGHDGPHHPDRLDRAGADGAADRHRDLPRGLRPDPRHARGGRARPRGDALGDDPDDGLPLLPLRDDLGGHARPGPRARRDDGRRDGALREPAS